MKNLREAFWSAARIAALVFSEILGFTLFAKYQSGYSCRTPKDFWTAAISFFFAFSISLSWAAEDVKTNPFHLIQGDPSAVVAQSVNVITGDFFDMQTDLCLPGAEPFILQRFLNSSSLGHTDPFKACQFNYDVSLDKENHSKFIFRDGYGSYITFYRDYHRHKLQKHEEINYHICSGILEKRITNTGQGEISSRTNLKNTIIYKGHKDRHAIVSDGFGHRYIFEHFSTSRNIRPLKTLSKPNGTEYHFSHKHDHLDHIEAVNTLDNQILHHVHFSTIHDSDTRTIEVRTLMNKPLKYELTKRKNSVTLDKEWVLTYVERPHAPWERYHYNPRKTRITKKERPQNRYLQIDYFGKGDPNNIRGYVKQLSAPAKDDGSSAPIPIYNFHYFPHLKIEITPLDNGGISATKTLLGGKTHVYNALGQLTVYHYNKHERINKIEQFGKDFSRPTIIQEFKWGNNGSNDCGNIKVKIVKDAQQVRSYQQYFYDSHGNVKQEILYGAFTGDEQPPMIVDDEKQLVNGDQIQKLKIKRKFVQSKQKDSHHYLIKSEDSPTQQHKIEYDYDAQDHLVAKYIIDEGVIRIRQFFEYGTSGYLKTEIIDDGTTYDKNDVSTVTERRIKRIQHYEKFPYGLPYIVEEKYVVDFVTGQEALLHKVVNDYWPEGHLKKQRHYDNQDRPLYELQWEYNEFGQVTKQKDALDLFTTRIYDDNGNLIEETNPRGDKLVFTYDFMNRLKSKSEEWNDGKTKLSTLYSYDYAGQCTAMQDIHGQVTRYSYDDFGHVKEIKAPSVEDELGLKIQPTTIKSHDIFGNVISTIDPLHYETKVSYTLHGKPYLCTYPDGSQEHSRYTVKGLLKKFIARNGTYTVYKHDYLGRITCEEVYSNTHELLKRQQKIYSAFHLDREIDNKGTVTQYTYDRAGRLIRKQKNQQRTDFGYDTVNRINETREVFGALDTDYIATIQTFDFANRLLSEKIIGGDGTTYSQFTMEYNDTSPQRTVIKKDADNQALTKTVFNAHGDIVSVSDAELHETRYDYDYKNKVVTVTDPNGFLSITYKDALDRVITEERKNPLGVVTKRTRFCYDAFGNLKRQIETVHIPDETSRDVETRWEYNCMRQVIKCLEGDPSSKHKETQYHYLPTGELEYIEKHNHVKLHHSYDGLGRLKEFYGSDDSFHYVYEYDALDNPWRVTDKTYHVETLKKYNDHNQLIEEILANGLTIGYNYDLMGRVIDVTLPDKSIIAYEYSGPYLFRVVRKNPSGKEIYAHTYLKYDLNGHLRKAQRIGKISEISYDYDLEGRLKKIEEPYFVETIEHRDPTGLLKRRTAQDALQQVTYEYVYDDNYQLKCEKGPFSHTYVNDSLFNQVIKDGVKGIINALNQLEMMASTHYHYDLNGNLAIRQNINGKCKYSYDALDRLTSIEDDSIKIIYRYDEANRRLTKEFCKAVNGDWISHLCDRFIYFTNTEVGLCDEKDGIKELRLLGLGKKGALGAAVAMELGGELFAPLHDHMGHVTGLIGSDGKIAEIYRFSSFGEELLYDADGEELSQCKNPWRYSSKRKDDESGLIYFGMRYYNLEVARWLTPDPIGLKGGPNLYSYILNNPLQYHDPFGLVDEAVAQENGASTFSDMMGRAGRALSSAIRAPGRLIEHVGRNWIPVPVVKDAVEFSGYVLAGRDVRNYKPSWKKHSGFYYTNEGADIPGVRYVICNGIDTSVKTLQERMFRAHDKLGIRVYGIHGADHGYLMDLFEVFLERVGVRTNQVIRMERSLRYLCADVGEKGVIYMKNHSRSVETFHWGSRGFSNQEKELFDVTNYGGAYLPVINEYGSLKNVIANKDFVTALANPLKYTNARRGQMANVEFLDYDGWPMGSHFMDSGPYNNHHEESMRFFKRQYGLPE